MRGNKADHGNDEIDDRKRLYDVVCRTIPCSAGGGRDRGRPEVSSRSHAVGLGTARPSDFHSGKVEGAEGMGMRRHLRGRKRMGFAAALLAYGTVGQARALPEMNGDPPLQVGEGECGPPVAAVDGADYGKEGFIFTDSKCLAVTERPAGWSKGAGEHDDFSDIGRDSSARRLVVGRSVGIVCVGGPGIECRQAGAG